MFYKKNEIRFHCTGCGKCCHGNPDDQVIELLDKELEQISGYLGMGISRFKKQFVSCDEFGVESIRIGDDHRCTLLGEDNRCTVYPVRPLQCQTYPYWPEIMDTKKHWEAEAARCEGVGQGEVIPLALIKSELARLGK